MRGDQRVRSGIGSTAAEQTEASAEAWAIDAENTVWLKAVIDTRGWPLRSQVGDKGALAVWLLAQHADHDVPFHADAWFSCNRRWPRARPIQFTWLISSIGFFARRDGTVRNPVLARARESGPVDRAAHRGSRAAR
jgi:hypothetical protein